MAIRRYARAPLLEGGKKIGTSRAGITLYTAAKNGSLKVERRTIREGERLDVIAGQTYGDSGLWWVIAAASGIGWNLQVPPGVVLTIPIDLGQVALYVG
jgi:nucleoid-associated protein YgaU